jgi:hypothetical protein
MISVKPLMSKKGISTVFATVLIIGLTVVSATILAKFLVPYVQRELWQSSECLDYKSYFTFQEKVGDKNYNCYNPAAQTYSFSLKAANINSEKNESIEGAKIKISNVDASQVIDVKSGADSACTEGLRLMSDALCEKSIILPAPRETKTYVYQSSTGFSGTTAKYMKAEVYPVISGFGGKSRVCEKSDEIELIQCV